MSKSCDRDISSVGQILKTLEIKKNPKKSLMFSVGVMK